jgi:biotin-(acetyl-CoA carboxylase) ligase
MVSIVKDNNNMYHVILNSGVNLILTHSEFLELREALKES